MKAHLLLLGAAAFALAGCGREEHTTVVPPQGAASATTAQASAPVAQASAPAGPVIAPSPAPAPITDAQRTAGAQLASQGTQGAPACNSCHGANGEGNPAMGAPRIAGQSRLYLVHELESYANGSRKNAVMQPIASALNADQRVAAAAHFASLAPAATATASAGAAPASAPARAAPAGSGGAGRGNQLASVGDGTLGVQGCANCHGPGGIGAGELYPYLAGQHASYLTATLGAWRDGSRNNDPTGQMPLIAKALSQQDVGAVAAFYAAQPPRPTGIEAEIMPPAGAASGPAVVSGPQSTTAAAMGSGSTGTGTGAEQGAATTGGAQGPGGGGGTSAQSNGQPPAPAAGASAPR